MRKWSKKLTSAFALVFVFVVLFVVGSGYSSAAENSIKYSKVRIYASSTEDILSMAEAGLIFDHIIAQANYFDVVLNDWEMGVLQDTGVTYEILVDDLEAEYQSRPKLSPTELAALEAEMKQKYAVQGFGFGSMGGYYTFNEIVQDLDEMVSLYPNLITAKQSIGTSIEGRDIWMVKISDNPNLNESEEEVLYTGLMHAREPQGMACAMYYMWYLLENYGSDPVVDFLVDNREMYFIPCVNPDGYSYNEMTNPNGGGMWRKNRRDNGGGVYGVDLNRNFSYQWGFNNSGSSPNPSSSTYRGTAPASEPETQTIQNFAINHNFTMAFNYHSVAGTFNFPWGYQFNLFTPDHNQFVAFSKGMSIFNNYPYGTPSQTLGYTTNGYSNDWFYGEQTLKNKTFSWTVEASGSGFWPPQSQIIPLADETLYSNFVLANGVSGGMPSIIDITLTPQNPPVIIPAGGGSFTFDITLTNVTNATWSFDVWNLINGSRTTLGPISPTFPPGKTFTGTLTQVIPAQVPPGQYTYAFNAGDFSTSQIISSDEFTFTKATSPTLSKAETSEAVDSWAVLVEAQSDHEIDFGLSMNEGLSILGNALPETFGLEQNYPNPFNPSTTIVYHLPQAERVSIVIYDLTGRQVKELVNEPKEAGSYTVQWDGRNQAGQTVASGVYIYKIQAGSFSQSRKLLFVK